MEFCDMHENFAIFNMWNSMWFIVCIPASTSPTMWVSERTSKGRMGCDYFRCFWCVCVCVYVLHLHVVFVHLFWVLSVWILKWQRNCHRSTVCTLQCIALSEERLILTACSLTLEFALRSRAKFIFKSDHTAQAPLFCSRARSQTHTHTKYRNYNA